MSSLGDTFLKLTDDDKYKILILLIASVVPDLTYIYIFHNDLIFNFDWVKLLLLSFMFSSPFL